MYYNDHELHEFHEFYAQPKIGLIRKICGQIKLKNMNFWNSESKAMLA